MQLEAAERQRTAYAQGLLRIVVALLFIQHGLAKLIDFPHMDNIATVFSVFGAMAHGFQLAAGLLETIGGVLLAAGLLARPVAFVLCGFSAVAYFIVHAPISFFPALNGGEHSVLFCFACLLLWVAGPGAFATGKGA
jgi:putative oxidoreductase